MFGVPLSELPLFVLAGLGWGIAIETIAVLCGVSGGRTDWIRGYVVSATVGVVGALLVAPYNSLLDLARGGDGTPLSTTTWHAAATSIWAVTTWRIAAALDGRRRWFYVATMAILVLCWTAFLAYQALAS